MPMPPSIWLTETWQPAVLLEDGGTHLLPPTCLCPEPCYGSRVDRRLAGFFPLLLTSVYNSGRNPLHFYQLHHGILHFWNEIVVPFLWAPVISALFISISIFNSIARSFSPFLAAARHSIWRHINSLRFAPFGQPDICILSPFNCFVMRRACVSARPTRRMRNLRTFAKHPHSLTSDGSRSRCHKVCDRLRPYLDGYWFQMY